MFLPVFPIYIRALVPLYNYATLIWFVGVCLLWFTRYTHQLGKRWGKTFYIVSSIVRPIGVMLIGFGWLALYAPNQSYPSARKSLLPRGNFVDILCWLAIIIFFAIGVWAVKTLGLRKSFLFRHEDDYLITSGPYALVRHPQFLSAIGVTFFITRLFNPAAFTMFLDLPNVAHYYLLDLNWALFTLSFWVLSILEDRELAAHFGKEYEEYAQKVPRIIPNK